jgi:AcrR family transcriptional regulator
MGAGESVLGLRDRKKIKTRDAILRESMRLFEANGYASTTVEQIAEAAEIAPSTFFRYFPTKESLVMANEVDKVMIRALASQPADVPSLEAFKRALETTLATVSSDDWQIERKRLQIVLAVPELKAAQLDGYHRTIAELAKAESRRTGRDPNDFESRVFIGALTGGLMAALEGHQSGLVKRMYRTLDFIEAGMPL